MKIVQSQHFLKTKDSQVFLANGPIKFKYSTIYATIENFITIRTYPTYQETALKFMNFICLFAKKLENLLFPKNLVIGQ